MSFSLSPPVKIVAAFGAILVVFAGVGSMLFGRGGSQSATHASVRHTHVAVHKTATVSKTATVHKTTTANGKTKTSATKTATASGKGGTSFHSTVRLTKVHGKLAAITTTTITKNGHTTTTTKTTIVKVTHPKFPTRPRGNLVSADLPAPLQWQLAKHHIVVVSFYDPQSDVDSIAVAEAHAGATAAGAGFLLVNVLDNSLAGPLTALLPGGGLLPDPGILIYRAPGTVAYRIDGFSDRDAVAQAVANAFSGQNGTTVTATSSSSTTVAAGATG